MFTGFFDEDSHFRVCRFKIDWKIMQAKPLGCHGANRADHHAPTRAFYVIRASITFRDLQQMLHLDGTGEKRNINLVVYQFVNGLHQGIEILG